MRAIIDRFEGEFVVCELDDKSILNIEKYKIPFDAKQGDVLLIDDIIIVDEEETLLRKNQIKLKMDKLWE